MTSILRCATIAYLFQAGASLVSAAPILHTDDFIPDSERTHFNSFEAIPTVRRSSNLFYSGGNGPYVEGGISIRQVNGDPGTDIWVNGPFHNVDGIRTWYQNGGTNGNSYVEITMADGSDFFDFGFYVQPSGFNTSAILFDLILNGTSVLTGSVPSGYNQLGYLGFGGGGYDTIRVRNNYSGGSTVYDGNTALALDALEARGLSTSVPEPGTLILIGLGLVGIQFITHARNKGLNIRQ